LLCFAGSGALVVLAAAFSSEYVRGPDGDSDTRGMGLGRVYRSDGNWYREIATNGYAYSPDRRSNVTFFPLYPLSGRIVREITGLSAEASLLVVSNFALALSFFLLLAYARDRFPEAPAASGLFVLLSFGLYPVTFFFRMPYTESLFFGLVLTAFLGMRRGWAPIWVAAIVGLATAARPVGIALVPAFLAHLWFRRTSVPAFLGRSLLLLPVCAWGLLAYMVYLWGTFDDPFAFALNQQHWHFLPKAAIEDRLPSLMALEPFWGYIDPESPFHCSGRHYLEPSVFSAPIMDRLGFVAWAGLTVVGWRKRWLSCEELLLSIGLVGMAYTLRGYEMGFFSMGRFTSVAFPIYLVCGRLLAAAPLALSVSLLSLSGFFLAAYTALFAAGYMLI